ncbi:MAG: TetR/AcrR family transcriptional regulator [Deltaproteobacteria bacterium]|nr:TetR/AcrR family transcriptional regulator [Deltaproteobacteria bacterium]
MATSAVPRSSDRIERKRQSRRDRIVEAAIEAIAEHGPAEFSLNQLAKDLDYTPGALYWYFASKEALVAEAQRIVLARLSEHLARERDRWLAAPALADEPRDVVALYFLLRQALFHLRLDRTHRAEARMLAFSVDPRVWLDAEQSRLLAPVLTELVRAAAAGFAEAITLGALDAGDPGRRAVQYWANNQGTVQLTKLARFAPDLFSPEELGMDSARALLGGWGARPEPLARAVTLVAGLAGSP